VLAGLGEVDAGLRSIDEALDIAMELGIPDDIGRAHVNRGDIIRWAGDPGRALTETLKAIDTAAEYGISLSYGAYLRLGAVQYGFLCGDWETAMAQLAEADRVAGTTAGTQMYRATYALEFLVAMGAPESEGLWEQMRALHVERPPNANAGPIYSAGVQLAALSDRTDEAIELAWEGLDRLGQTDGWPFSPDVVRAAAWPVADKGTSARAGGDDESLDAARAEMGRLADLVQEAMDRLGHPTGSLGRILETTSMQVTAERSRMEGASDFAGWREVADSWAGIGQPYRELYARWREAEAAEATGDRETASAVLRAAYGTASRLGARPLAERLETLARKMRLRLGEPAGAAPAEPSAAYGLTPRELEVLALVAAGRTNRQIADELFISGSTAGVHVSNILGKLGFPRAPRRPAWRSARASSRPAAEDALGDRARLSRPPGASSGGGL
jgi:DNA-binding CsgD family transcriptional regulator